MGATVLTIGGSILVAIITALSTILIQRRVSVSQSKKTDVEAESLVVKTSTDLVQFLRTDVAEVRKDYAEYRADAERKFAANDVRITDLNRRITSFESREKKLARELETHEVWDQKAQRLLKEAGIQIEKPPELISQDQMIGGQGDAHAGG